jgi:hypothetical protein
MADQLNDYGNSVANSAIKTGENAINSFDPNATANNQRTNWSNLFNTQQGTQDNFLNSYNSKIASQPSLSDSYAKFGAANNLTGLGQQATTLNNAVLKAPQQNIDLARGFNYDQNQIDQKTNQDLTKLQPLASAATNAFQTAQDLTNQQVGYQQTQNQYELQPLQAQQEMITDAFARQMTGYTQANEAELQGLIAKMNQGVALSTAEISRANALASAQASYNAAIDSANIANQYQTVDSGQNLVNTFTNGIINPSMLTSKTGVAQL